MECMLYYSIIICVRVTINLGPIALQDEQVLDALHIVVFHLKSYTILSLTWHTYAPNDTHLGATDTHTLTHGDRLSQVWNFHRNCMNGWVSRSHCSANIKFPALSLLYFARHMKLSCVFSMLRLFRYFCGWKLRRQHTAPECREICSS